MIGTRPQPPRVILSLWGRRVSLKKVKSGTSVAVASSSVHNRFSTSAFKMEASAEPGHGLISFINASPTRKPVHHNYPSDTQGE